MADSNIAFRAMLMRWLVSSRRIIAVIEPRWLVVAASLASIVAFRLLPTSYLHWLDNLIGRPGDGLLLIAMLFLGTSPFLLFRSHQKKVRMLATPPVAAILVHHLQLDQEIDKRMTEVVADTESSAIAIIQKVRELHDTAAKLAAYLDGSSSEAGHLETGISESMACLTEIGTFIQYLPAKMERDLHNVRGVCKEIKDLDDLVEAVQAISMQSHLLAINAAIEASHAGRSGAGFRIVANEVRVLASNTNAVAARIKEGLSHARHAVEDGIATNIAESSRQLRELSHTGLSITSMQKSLEEMRGYYKNRFEIITTHNEELAKEIAEILGQIQYQDVVRQCIERMQVAIGKRNIFLQKSVDFTLCEGADLTQLPDMLEQILSEYVVEENNHRHSARHVSGNSGELKIELF